MTDAPLVATLLAQLRATSPAEAVSVLAGMAYVLLARRRSRWCWVAGAVSAAILGYLSFGAALPMQVRLAALVRAAGGPRDPAAAA